MTEISQELVRTASDKSLTYDVFADFRLPLAELTGESLTVLLSDGSRIQFRFDDTENVTWSAEGAFGAAASTDPCDAVEVRDGVFCLNLPCTGRPLQSLGVLYSLSTRRAIVARSEIQPEQLAGTPQMFAAVLVGNRRWRLPNR